MPLHDDLLRLARDLVARNSQVPVEAELRRAISTAYYALFHLLVHEASTRIVAIAAVRPRVARGFEHRSMKKVCQEYSSKLVDLAGQPVSPDIQWIAQTFVELQQARHDADYNTAINFTHTEADTNVILAESAFLEWEIVESDPAASIFLAELIFQSIRSR